MFFSWEKHIKSLTSKISGTLIVKRFLVTICMQTIISNISANSKPYAKRPKGGLFDEKTEGQKSRDTSPLKKSMHRNYIHLINSCSLPKIRLCRGG
jgi:hypothetical protein